MAKSTKDAREFLFFETLKDEEVETEESADETDDDETEDEETEGDETEDETDDEDEDESDDDESEEEDESEDEDAELDKRFPQLKGETLTEYKDSLETAYAESTTEYNRLKGLLDKSQPAVEALSKIIAKHPELAEEIGSEAATAANENEFPKNPTQVLLEQQVAEVQQREYSEFNKKLKDDGVDLEADPKLANELNSALAVVRDHVWRSERRIVGMGEGLERAWKLMGKEIDPKDKLRNAAKKVGGQKRSAGGKKAKSAVGKLTPDQVKVAERFGLKPETVARHVTN